MEGTNNEFNFRGGFSPGIGTGVGRPVSAVSESSDHSSAQSTLPMSPQLTPSSSKRQPPTTPQIFSQLNQPKNTPSGRSQEYGKQLDSNANPSTNAARRARDSNSSTNTGRQPPRPQAQMQGPMAQPLKLPSHCHLPKPSRSNHYVKGAQSSNQGKEMPRVHDKQKQKKEADVGRPRSKNNIPQPQIMYQEPPSRVLRAPIQQQQHYERGALDNRNILSPKLTSQIPPATMALLKNPVTSLITGPNIQPCNPYVPRPQSPYFFDIFGSFGEEGNNKKYKNSKKYFEFNGLSLKDQLKEFFKAQTLTKDELRVRWQLILDISFVLRQEYPNCELYPFGSILTGLGDCHSDIDIYVDLSGDSTSNHRPDEQNRKQSSNLSLSRTKKLIRKGKCPHTKRWLTKQVIPITSAKVPILKLMHSWTGIFCDLSFENRLSVQNTKLIRFYMNMDKGISEFMVLIRCWAKFHGLTGSNCIKNYALTLLVLVYLCKNKLVPSVHLLQTLKREEREYLNLPNNTNEIDGWDASFCDNIKRINERFRPRPLTGASSSKTPSDSSILIKMAVEFFTMYAELDFSRFVVCPLLGDFLLRSKFTPGCERLPTSLKRYTDWAMEQSTTRRLNIDSFLCVQDPFLLSFNVGSVTPQSTLFKFQIACAKTASLLRQAGYLKSLLDVFVPLPDHIGDKKFMRVYKTETTTKELIQEIKTAITTKNSLDKEIDAKPSTSSVASTSQKSNYVELPPHLSHLDTLMDEKCLKQLDKKGRWETFMDFTLSQKFESVFMTELALCRIQNHKKIDLVGSLCELWREFTLDFISDFFVKGLKLDLEKKLNASQDSVSKVKMSSGGRRSEAQAPRWNLKYLSKKEEEAFGPTTKNPSEIDQLCKKMLGLPTLRTPIYYEFLRIHVTYPFWENRSTILAETTKKTPAEIEVPFLTQKKDKKNIRNRKTEIAGSDKQSPADLLQPYAYLRSFINPVTLQGLVSSKINIQRQERMKKTDKPFRSFYFNILIKLDLSSINSRPHTFILFEMDPAAEGNQKQKEFKVALSTIANILDEDLPNYLIYRLAKWLDLRYPSGSFPASTSATKIASAPISEAVVAFFKSAKPEESPGAVDQIVVNEANKSMKNKRTKSEEDLLIPTSSSSDSLNSSEAEVKETADKENGSEKKDSSNSSDVEVKETADKEDESDKKDSLSSSDVEVKGGADKEDIQEFEKKDTEIE